MKLLGEISLILNCSLTGLYFSRSCSSAWLGLSHLRALPFTGVLLRSTFLELFSLSLVLQFICSCPSSSFGLSACHPRCDNRVSVYSNTASNMEERSALKITPLADLSAFPERCNQIHYHEPVLCISCQYVEYCVQGL